MRSSISVNSNVGGRDIKQVNVSGFRGVDFSSSAMKVAKTRGVNGTKNYIWEDNINHRRPGWNQVAYFGDVNINGVYVIGTDEMLVYAGTSFYILELVETGIGYEKTLLYDVSDNALLADQKVEFYPQGTNVFIVGAGDFLVFNGTTILPVFEHDDTYIPTTTIAVDYTGFSGTSEKAAYEKMNLMTRWRKNTCRGRVGSNVESPVVERQFILDAEIFNTMLQEGYEVDATVTIVYQPSVGDPETLVLEGRSPTSIGDQTVKLFDSIDQERGHIENNGVYATLVLDDVITEPVTAGEDNITVEFKAIHDNYTLGDKSYLIRTATFGALFGVDGITSQLFVSGFSGQYQSHLNRDFFSFPLDFTYWPETYYRDVGNSPIIGYARLNDGTMLLFKDTVSGEAAIYIRTGTFAETLITEEYDTIYIEKAGYPGFELASRNSIASFAGDNIYLTNTGVRGITLSDSVTTDERYARERSKYIDTDLKTRTLSGAVAIVFDNRYYLAVDDVCYVADARFKTSEAEDMDDTFNYEWWFWDNIPARVFFEMDGALYFGTDDGRICVFNSVREDVSFEEVVSGNMSFHPSDDTVVHNAALEVEDGMAIKFDKDTLFEVVFDTAVVEDFTTVNGTIQIIESTLPETPPTTPHPEYNLFLINEGDEFLLVGDNDDYNKVCFVDNIDLGNRTFDLIDINGNPVNVTAYCTNVIRLLKALTETEVFVVDHDDVAHTFHIARVADGYPMEFIFYNTMTEIDDSTNVNVAIILITHTPMDSIWVTPYFDGGTTVYAKTLISLTVTTEPAASGDLRVGYEVRNFINEGAVSGFAEANIEDLSLNTFSLANVAASYTKRIKALNVNYFYFWFKSSGTSDTVIVGLNCRFYITNVIRGAR